MQKFILLIKITVIACGMMSKMVMWSGVWQLNQANGCIFMFFFVIFFLNEISFKIEFETIFFIDFLDCTNWMFNMDHHHGKWLSLLI